MFHKSPTHEIHSVPMQVPVRTDLRSSILRRQILHPDVFSGIFLPPPLLPYAVFHPQIPHPVQRQKHDTDWQFYRSDIICAARYMEFSAGHENPLPQSALPDAVPD